MSSAREQFPTSPSVPPMLLQPKRIIMIGFGNYAKKAHFSQVERYSINNSISLEAVLIGGMLADADAAAIRTVNPKCQIVECKDKDEALAKIESLLVKRNQCADLTGIHGAIVSSVPGFQYDLVAKCLEHNLHVLVDKPAVCPPDCCWVEKQAEEIPVQYERLVGLADKNKVRLIVGAQRRYEKIYGFILDARPYLDARRLTAISACHILGKKWMPTRQPQSWKQDPKCTGGKLSFSGYHIVDVVMWWLQSTNPGLVKAEVSAAFRRIQHSKLEQSVAATLSFYTQNSDPDCLVQLDLSFDGPSDAVLESYRVRTDGWDRISISRDLPVRSGAVAEVVLQRETDSSHTVVNIHGATAANAAATCDFLEGLIGNPPKNPISDGSSHVNSHRLIGAIYQAGISGKNVPVLLIP